MNRAIQQGVTFSEENLAEISTICNEDSFMKALCLSESKLKVKDLEDLYGCIDDEIIIDIARKYQIDLPKDIAGLNYRKQQKKHSKVVGYGWWIQGNNIVWKYQI